MLQLKILLPGKIRTLARATAASSRLSPVHQESPHKPRFPLAAHLQLHLHTHGINFPYFLADKQPFSPFPEAAKQTRDTQEWGSEGHAVC